MSMTYKDIPTLYTLEDLEKTIQALGFLPYFANHIPGFSVEEHCDPAYYVSEIDGPWEWKGPAIRDTQCTYGKFYRKKAGYISKDWFGDFMNYRRDGYDLDARFNDHLATTRQLKMFEVLNQYDSLLSLNYREKAGYEAHKSQFETLITQLQMMGYITTSDFVYRISKTGQPYGWGLARYATIERYYGDDYIAKAYKSEPEASYSRIIAHLQMILPDVSLEDIKKLID